MTDDTIAAIAAITAPETEATEVVITGETAKLPAAYAEYTDPQKTLPADVVFFERRVTFGEMTKTISLSGGIGCLGILSVIFGFSVLFDHTNVAVGQTSNFGPLFFGVTCLFAAWIMAQSLKLSRNVIRKQQRGEPTRVGVFLTPNTLFIATENDYTIIPRSEFRGLGGLGKKTVQYLFKGQNKQLHLPDSLVRDDPAALISSIQQWSSSTVASEQG